MECRRFTAGLFFLVPDWMLAVALRDAGALVEWPTGSVHGEEPSEEMMMWIGVEGCCRGSWFLACVLLFLGVWWRGRGTERCDWNEEPRFFSVWW